MKGAPVPDIATLRAICHAGKLAKDRRPWYSFFRWVSSYLSWLVLHTGLLPNHITMMSVACAILGTVLLATPSPRMALWGGFAFLLHHLLDKVDGDVARIRKIYSLAGVYLDELGHSFAFAGIFAGLALHLAWRTQGTGQVIIVLMAGTIGALSIVLARQNKSMGFLLFAQNVLTQPELLPAERPAQAVHVLSREAVLQHREAGGAGHRGWLSALRDAVLVVADFTFVMLLAVAGLIAELLTGDPRALIVVLFAQAALQCAVLVALIWINYSVNIETECRRLNRLVRERHASSSLD